MKSKKITAIGLCAAMICIIAPVSIPVPFSPVNISLTPLAIFISAYILTPSACVCSTFVYIALGTMGLPVFSGFMGGAGVLAGPTGGYLAGFLFTAFISSFFINKFHYTYLHITGMIFGIAAAYLFGTVWFSFSQDVSFISAFTVCVLPYIVWDGLKITAAVLIGKKLRKSKLNL